MAKRLVCERVLAGGQDGYDTIVPAPEDMEQSQSNLKSLRQDKRALKDANTALTREIGSLVEKILGCQHDLQETLQEIASFGEDSPYAPAQAVSHFQNAAPVSQEDEEKTLRLAISKLETRVNEIDEYATATYNVHGFYLDDFSGQHATFAIDLERIAHDYLSDADAAAFINYCTQDASDAKDFSLKLSWTLQCELFSVEVPFMTESFEDIIDAAIDDNSPSFCLREASRRIHCFVKRFKDIQELTRTNKLVSLLSSPFDSVVGFSISGAPNCVVGISVPSEYPHLGAKLLHITPSSGNPLDCSSFRTVRFDSIATAIQAALGTISAK